MNDLAINIKKRIEEILDKCEFSDFREQFSITINKVDLLKIAELLKNEFSFEQLIDITAVDYLGKREKRYSVVYFLYSISHKFRMRINVAIEDGEVMPTLTKLWDSADWYERETYDMFGIIFEDHPDLRRFYMPEDFTHPLSGEQLHPLRKDFPLMGIEDSLPLPKFPEKAEIEKNKK
jgi:NADH-quinone oxidoreductase subunit C